MNQGDAVNALHNIISLAEQTAVIFGLAKGRDYDLTVAFSFDPEDKAKAVQIDPDVGITRVLGLIEVLKPGENEPTVAILPCLTLTYFEHEEVVNKLALMLSNYIYRIVSDEEHHTIEMMYTVESLTAGEAQAAEAGITRLGRTFAEGLGLSYEDSAPFQLDLNNGGE